MIYLSNNDPSGNQQPFYEWVYDKKVIKVEAVNFNVAFTANCHKHDDLNRTESWYDKSIYVCTYICMCMDVFVYKYICTHTDIHAHI